VLRYDLTDGVKLRQELCECCYKLFL